MLLNNLFTQNFLIFLNLPVFLIRNTYILASIEISKNMTKFLLSANFRDEFFTNKINYI
jgi:hypothetical protein